MAEQMTPDPGFYALTESLELGKATCREAGLELSALEERTFEGGEFKLRPLASVRDRPAYVLQSLAGSPTTSIAFIEKRRASGKVSTGRLVGDVGGRAAAL